MTYKEADIYTNSRNLKKGKYLNKMGNFLNKMADIKYEIAEI